MNLIRRNIENMRAIRNTINFISGHPLSGGGPTSALISWLRWHLGLRITGQPMVFDYVDDTKLIGRLGVRNSSTAYWVGLIDLHCTGFLLHYLREDDIFYDVGANIGLFSILAGIVRKANCVAFEPVPETFLYLTQNINLNGNPAALKLFRQGVGDKRGELSFTTSRDATNHVLGPNEPSGSSVIKLPVVPLDEVAEIYNVPTVLKIDVMGFEDKVISGASKVLESLSLNAVMLEHRNHGARYGVDENEIYKNMLALGFKPYVYDPFERQFLNWKRKSETELGDILYLRDLSMAESRVRESPRFHVKGFNL